MQGMEHESAMYSAAQQTTKNRLLIAGTYHLSAKISFIAQRDSPRIYRPHHTVYTRSHSRVLWPPILLQWRLSPSNVCRHLLAAEYHKCASMASFALDYLAVHFDEVLYGDETREISPYNPGDFTVVDSGLRLWLFFHLILWPWLSHIWILLTTWFLSVTAGLPWNLIVMLASRKCLIFKFIIAITWLWVRVDIWWNAKRNKGLLRVCDPQYSCEFAWFRASGSSRRQRRLQCTCVWYGAASSPTRRTYRRRRNGASALSAYNALIFWF